MNKIMLSLVLAISFSVLIVLGVGFFHIMSTILNSNLAVLCVGFVLLYIVCFIAVSNVDGDLSQLPAMDNDDEEIV